MFNLLEIVGLCLTLEISSRVGFDDEWWDVNWNEVRNLVVDFGHRGLIMKNIKD